MRGTFLALATMICAAPALPVVAQTQTAPIIPNLIAPDTSSDLISVKVDRGLTSNKSLRSASLRQARTRLQKGGDVTNDELRALAAAGDGLAAQRYVRILHADILANSFAWFRGRVQFVHGIDHRTHGPDAPGADSNSRKKGNV